MARLARRACRTVQSEETRTMTAGVDMTAVEAVVLPILRAHGVELVEITFKTEHGVWVLRVTVERPDALEPGFGLTLDLLAEISRDLSSALDVAELIAQRYNLEVSSPGLDRPLRSLADYRRFAGKLAKVYLSQPAPDGQRVLRGVLVGADDERVTVEVDGRPITVPFADVSRGHLVFEMGGRPKPRPKGSKKKGKGSKS